MSLPVGKSKRKKGGPSFGFIPFRRKTANSMPRDQEKTMIEAFLKEKGVTVLEPAYASPIVGSG